MMRNAMLAGLSLMLLAGCGGGDTAAEKAGTAAPSGEPVQRQPGNWTNAITIEKFDVPGAPADMKAGMQQMMSAASGQPMCLTPEDAAKDDISQRMSEMAARDAECTWTRRDVAGGTIDIAGTCKAANGGKAELAMAGTASPTKSDIRVTTRGFNAAGASEGEMVMRVVSTRTGECDGG